MKTKKKIIDVNKDDGIYTFDDSRWQNPNKTKREMELLSYRGRLLSTRQKMPLVLKEIYARNRIQKIIDEYGIDNCVVGFSGGKDSTVLYDLILKMGCQLPTNELVGL